jgi:hypothetical protein
VLDYTHYTIENGERYCLQSSPMVASNEDAQVSATRKGDRAWYFWLYPNFMINIYEGVMDTNLVLPIGPDKCRVIFDFYFADVSPERASTTPPASPPATRCRTKTLPSASPCKRAWPRAPTEPAACQ